MKSVKKVCEEFVLGLGPNAVNGDVFNILAEVAESLGLEMQAHQKGISGTYIVFVELPKKS